MMPKILVIEDADPLRNDIVEMLGFEGFDVRGADNGRAGVDVAREYHPELIVCDIMMPELDGYEVLETLREDGKTASIPFIFLTAKTDRSDIRYGMGLGADDYLTKPFMANELLDTIRARLRRHDTFSEIAERQVQELRESIITALPHELRTPLNTIMGFSEMLATEAPRLKPDEITKWSMHIQESGKRLNHLLENYLMYARVETLRVDHAQVDELRRQSSEPTAVILMMAEQKAVFYNRKSDLDTTSIPAELPYIAISEQDMSKIIEELVDNAFKFSKAGTPVSIMVGQDEKCFVLKISDKGRGMTQEQIGQVGAHIQFDRFLHEQQGVGLGLTIVKNLVEIYGGSIMLSDENNEGTTVTVKLPLASRQDS